VSRMLTDKLVVRDDDIDLRDVIETAVEATAPLFVERRVRLACEIPDRPFPVRGDDRRLVQVIANLLSNAATYSPADTLVTLRVASDERAIHVFVDDHGEGIPVELQPRIFDLFVQSDQKLDRSRGGLGVGLSLARTIVELHRGKIEVHSEGPGRGSQFHVQLPHGRASSRMVVTSSVAAPCRIVLVDDQDDSRDMLRELFEAANHVVFDASDGGRAVQLIAEHKPDVAFIDIGLPVMNGFEVAQQIRQRPELRDVLLVALSGYGNTTDVQAALAAGFDHHITKPAELGTLEQILARVKPAAES